MCKLGGNRNMEKIINVIIDNKRNIYRFLLFLYLFVGQYT